MSLMDFRAGKPKPGEFYWYTGNRDKQGAERPRRRYKHPVEVMSFPCQPDTPDEDILLFVRHTPGDPTTASWVILSELGEMLVSLEPPKG